MDMDVDVNRLPVLGETVIGNAISYVPGERGQIKLLQPVGWQTAVISTW